MRHSILLVLLTPMIAYAQLPLPYSTGFDNSTQQFGWQQYRTGHLSNYDWTYTSGSTQSQPTYLWHDYPVGGAETDTVRDWFISPVLDLTAGAWFTCRINMFAISGSTFPSDSCTVVLLTGSADPNNAVITHVVDLLPLVTSSATYTQLPAVQIPPMPNGTRIAFYYQATHNWLTPGIDDVNVTPLNVGIPENTTPALAVTVSPQPTNGPFTISASTDGDHVLTLFTARGERVLTDRFRQRTRIDADLAPGAYLYRVSDTQGNVRAQGRVMVE